MWTAMWSCVSDVMKYLIFVFIFLGLPVLVFATDYYVDKDSIGGACNDSNNGTALATPWCTIQKAADTASAGDTVHIRQGTYLENSIAPANSGTSGNVITYKSYTGEQATISYTWYSAMLWLQDGVDYISIENIIFDGDFLVHGAFRFRNSEHITISDCVIKDFQYKSSPEADPAGGVGLWLDGNCHYFLIEDTDIYHCGSLSNPSSQAGGNVNIRKGDGVTPGNNNYISFVGCSIYESYTEDGIQIGDNVACTGFLVDDCNIYDNKEDGLDIKQVVDGVVRNSTISGHAASVTGGGAGVVIHMGSSGVTVENCTISGNKDGVAIAGSGSSAEDVIVRYCIFRDNQRGLRPSRYSPDPPGFTNLSAYNNVYIENTYGIYFMWWPDGQVGVVNSIFDANTDYDFTDYNLPNPNLVYDYNNYVTAGGSILYGSTGYTRASLYAATTHEEHGLIVDPLFVDRQANDFGLQSSSTCIDVGSSLTFVDSSDTGTGTSLIVDNALYFQDGNGVDNVDADYLAVNTVTNSVQISSINYDTNTITLAGSINRNDADDVWLYKDSDGTRVLYGSAPDIGAEEYVVLVNITATDASASETGPDTGTFQITCPECTGGESGTYIRGGTATFTTDYTDSGDGTWAFAELPKNLIVTPVSGDGYCEAPEAVVFILNASTGCSIGAASDSIDIEDDSSDCGQAPATPGCNVLHQVGAPDWEHKAGGIAVEAQ